MYFASSRSSGLRDKGRISAAAPFCAGGENKAADGGGSVVDAPRSLGADCSVDEDVCVSLWPPDSAPPPESILKPPDPSLWYGLCNVMPTLIIIRSDGTGGGGGDDGGGGGYARAPCCSTCLPASSVAGVWCCRSSLSICHLLLANSGEGSFQLKFGTTSVCRVGARGRLPRPVLLLLLLLLVSPPWPCPSPSRLRWSWLLEPSSS
ncbi:hypothetical protein F5Y10DRAFT_232279 [Nemania abortiva]|nr:hypothetical protein F5Y10DRAFT_232279 [Nemania abortiva]